MRAGPSVPRSAPGASAVLNSCPGRGRETVRGSYPSRLPLKNARHTWVGSFFFFPVAFTRAARLRPLAFGVHDEMLPRDQGEGGDAEDHWAIRSHWETAGQRIGVGGPQATGTHGLGVCFFLCSRWLQIGALKSQGRVGGRVLVSDMPLPPD